MFAVALPGYVFAPWSQYGCSSGMIQIPVSGYEFDIDVNLNTPRLRNANTTEHLWSQAANEHDRDSKGQSLGGRQGERIATDCRCDSVSVHCARLYRFSTLQ